MNDIDSMLAELKIEIDKIDDNTLVVWPYPDDKVWVVQGEPLTGAQLRAAYRGLAESRDRFLAALGVGAMSSRRADRALSLLKRAGLAYYDRETRAWAVVEVSE